MSHEAILIIDSPHKDSNLIYATGYYCLDPFIYLEYKDQKIGWLPSTELEKAKLKSKMTRVYNLSEALTELNKDNKYPPYYSSIAANWLKNHKINHVKVSSSFSVSEALNLKSLGIDYNIVKGDIFKNRIQKTEEEICYIRENSKKNCNAMQEVYQILAESSITNDHKIKYQGEILTAEYIQNYLLKSFIDKGMMADSVIVAVGNQGCYPHEYGSGELKAHTSIIVDIYPRSRSNFYHSDMTRTFCKGKADDELKKIYNTVLEAQKLGLEKVQAQINGLSIHQAIKNYFNNNGFKTGVINGILQGFIHGTGHGLGLDCHEGPSISLKNSILPLNSVVSVEPGLYYLDKGAVRIEDLVVVKEKGFENLIDFHKDLEIP